MVTNDPNEPILRLEPEHRLVRRHAAAHRRLPDDRRLGRDEPGQPNLRVRQMPG